MQHHRDRASPGNDEAGHDCHRAGLWFHDNQHHHSGAPGAAAQADEKRFATRQAQLAQLGFTLQRTDVRDGAVEFVVGFRGHHKVLRTLAAVEAFARHIGAIK